MVGAVGAAVSNAVGPPLDAVTLPVLEAALADALGRADVVELGP